MAAMRKQRQRILMRMRDFLKVREMASAKEITSFLNEEWRRGVTVAQVSNFLSTDPSFRKVRSVRTGGGVRGGAVWLWGLS